jgi:hypothetical protein
MPRKLRNRFWTLATVLAVLAGLVYNSWPLGYWLNPAASKAGLASGLEALHQPYNWLFISGDVLSGLLIILACGLMWHRLRAGRQHRLLGWVLVNLVVFGLGTIADTLLPERCLPGAPACPSWRQDHLLLAHGVLSIVAAIGLFLSLVLVWRQHRTAVLNTLAGGYVLFGAFSLFEALVPLHGNWSQHYYLLLCGAWLGLVPYTVRRTFEAEKPRKTSDPSARPAKTPSGA